MAVIGALAGRHELGEHEGAASVGAGEADPVQHLGAFRRLLVAGPLRRADALQQFEAHAPVSRRQAGDLVENLAGVVVMGRVAHGIHQLDDDFPILIAGQRLDHLAHSVHAALGAGEGALLFQRGTAGQEHVGVLRGFVQEQVLQHHAFHVAEGCDDMLLVRVTLHRVLAHDEHAAEVPGQRGVEHVRQPQARLAVQPDAPFLFEGTAHFRIGDEAVAAEDMRPTAEAASALHIALTAQGIDADAFAAEHAAGQSQVAQAHDAGRALRMLGHAEAVVDRAVRAAGIGAGRLPNGLRVEAGLGADDLGRVAVVADQRHPALELVPLAAFAHEGFVVQLLAHDDMGDAVQHGNVGAGPQRQMHVGAAMRRVHRLGPARVDHDQFGALADAALHERAEHRMPLGRVGADHHDHIGLQDGVEMLTGGAPADRGRHTKLRR